MFCSQRELLSIKYLTNFKVDKLYGFITSCRQNNMSSGHYCAVEIFCYAKNTTVEKQVCDLSHSYFSNPLYILFFFLTRRARRVSDSSYRMPKHSIRLEKRARYNGKNRYIICIFRTTHLVSTARQLSTFGTFKCQIVAQTQTAFDVVLQWKCPT